MKILITAGSVYGRLDDNKLVSNRARGIWAKVFAEWLVLGGHEVTMVLPKTARNEDKPHVGEIVYHDGFEDYQEICVDLARSHDGAVMAAAVVNWIPETPIKGKMATEGYQPGDTIDIRFKLAPRVIEAMKVMNPKLNLIGCKMTSGDTTGSMLRQAYKVVRKAHCNVVVANDLTDLKTKYLLFPDGTCQQYRVEKSAPFYEALHGCLTDRFYSTVPFPQPRSPAPEADALYQSILQKHKAGFVRSPDGELMFGSIAVRIDALNFLVSPREKPDALTAAPVVVRGLANGRVFTSGGKASLNAPLLIRHLEKYPKAKAVLHQHSPHRLLDGPVAEYAPPGTLRDNDREIPAPCYTIEGHGFVTVLDEDLNPVAPTDERWSG